MGLCCSENTTTGHGFDDQFAERKLGSPNCGRSGKFDTDNDLDRLLVNNQNWIKRKNESDPEFFSRIGKGQQPEFLYIGCSDSRVPINEITGLDLGELFVARNVANLVVPSDMNLLTCLTYAVKHLKVKHILVTGHYDCGGIKAAVKSDDLGVLD